MDATKIHSVDASQAKDLVFGNNENEKSSWNFCKSVTVPRSEVLFSTEAALVY